MNDFQGTRGTSYSHTIENHHFSFDQFQIIDAYVSHDT